jgi:hypothetical protein
MRLAVNIFNKCISTAVGAILVVGALAAIGPLTSEAKTLRKGLKTQPSIYVSRGTDLRGSSAQRDNLFEARNVPLTPSRQSLVSGANRTSTPAHSTQLPLISRRSHLLPYLEQDNSRE